MRFKFLEEKNSISERNWIQEQFKLDLVGSNFKEKEKCIRHFYFEKHLQVKYSKQMQVYQYCWFHRK